MSKVPADFFPEYLRETEVNTRRILNSTVGKVLVIDNAEVFDGSHSKSENYSYKQAAINTIVSMVQGTPGEDRCIILVGNKTRIKAMMRAVNLDLACRFPTGSPFRFTNFSLEELKKLVEKTMNEKDLGYTQETIHAALSTLRRALVRPNFNNASTVNQIIEAAQSRWVSRVTQLPQIAKNFSPKVEPIDFDPDVGKNLHSGTGSFNELKGRLNISIIDQLDCYRNRYLGALKRTLYSGACLPMNFIFHGLPGSGRTTTARYLGKMFHAMKILRVPEIVECYGRDFVADTATETARKTQNRLTSYLGRAVLIRDADYLCDSTAAVHQICHFLGQEDNQGKMIIILSGLTADMTLLMSTWAILLAFFDEQLVFENISPQECISLLVRELDVSKVVDKTSFLQDPESDSYRNVCRFINVLQQLPGWCNARDIRQLARQMLGLLLEESAGAIDVPGQPLPTLSLDNVIQYLKRRITQRRDQYVVQVTNETATPPLSSSIPPTPQIAHGPSNRLVA